MHTGAARRAQIKAFRDDPDGCSAGALRKVIFTKHINWRMVQVVDAQVRG